MLRLLPSSTFRYSFLRHSEVITAYSNRSLVIELPVFVTSAASIAKPHFHRNVVYGSKLLVRSGSGHPLFETTSNVLGFQVAAACRQQVAVVAKFDFLFWFLGFANLASPVLSLDFGRI